MIPFHTSVFSPFPSFTHLFSHTLLPNPHSMISRGYLICMFPNFGPPPHLGGGGDHWNLYPPSLGENLQKFHPFHMFFARWTREPLLHVYMGLVQYAPNFNIYWETWRKKITPKILKIFPGQLLKSTPFPENCEHTCHPYDSRVEGRGRSPFSHTYHCASSHSFSTLHPSLTHTIFLVSLPTTTPPPPQHFFFLLTLFNTPVS